MNVASYPVAKRTALWVKEYAHALRVLGGLLFVLTLLFGLLWVGDFNVESVAFVLSLLSTLCFAAPSVANYVVPNRKPIRDMTFDEIMAFIPQTDPKADWHGVSMQWASEKFLKEDPRLRFRSSMDEVDIQNDDFVEDWANRYPHRKATGYFYNLSFEGALIDRFILVSVDGGRALLPAPRADLGTIRRIDYVVAQIHDTLGTLDQYIELSGLEHESAP